MKALVTGASSGIGKEIALQLSELGYDLYVVSRNKQELDKIFINCPTSVTTIELDLGKSDNCHKLHQMLKNQDIDILVNNAGFGDAGNFTQTSLNKELDMIDLNIKAYHILTKLFLKDFTKKDRGRILNIASMAGFMPGPYMATYYATKSYIVNLTLAIQEEIKKEHSNVKMTIFCPGPVQTNFTKRAKVHFKIPSLSSKKAAQCAIEGMFQNKTIIIPNNMKPNYILVKISPIKAVLTINALIQERATPPKES